jgi:hypothetical protein
MSRRIRNPILGGSDAGCTPTDRPTMPPMMQGWDEETVAGTVGKTVL